METSEIVKTYEELAGIPTPGTALSVVSSDQEKVQIHSYWSQRDLVKSEASKFSRIHLLRRENGGLRVDLATPAQDLVGDQWNRLSASGEYRAVLKKTNIKNEDRQFIEIWQKNRKLRTVDLKTNELHDKVYEPDGEFGCFEWSPSETKLLYIAEKKRPKTASFFNAKKTGDRDNAEKEDSVIKGDEHVFVEDWGEQLVGKSQPVLCVLDVLTGGTTVHDTFPEDVSPGQARWCANDTEIVFVGFFNKPYRLGLIYCNQRRSALYHLHLQSGQYILLSDDSQAIRSPVVSPDKSGVVYLQNPASGAHSQCSQINRVDLNSKKSTVITEIVRTAADDGFPGIFIHGNMPRRCFASDDKRIIISTTWRSQQVILVINLEDKSVKPISKDPSIGGFSVLDVHNDVVIATCSSPTMPSHLVCATLPPAGSEENIVWLKLDGSPTTFTDLTWEIRRYQVPEKSINSAYSHLDYEGVLYLPKMKDQSRKPPFVVFPHGGPHTCFTAEYMMYFTGICKCGFAVLLVNYRGSTGFGEDSIESLLGNVGSQDVNDVQFAAEQIVNSGLVDKDRVCVIGGSHGGFLTAHLIGQFPEFYKAAVCRNPVINVATMMGITDIPDWCWEEGGVPFEHAQLPSSEAYEKVWTCSPLRHAHKIQTPVMIMLGCDDLRVPPKQGHELRRLLQARNVPVRLLSYTGNSHPITKVDSEADAFVNIILWFQKYTT